MDAPHLKHPNLVKLWEHLYRVSIPAGSMQPIEYHREVGMLSSGDPKIDLMQANAWTPTWITINTMIDLHTHGVPIRVTDYKDTKLIYDSISEHLERWLSQLRRAVNIGGAPIDELMAMDDFANTVYAHAKYVFTHDVVNSLLGQHMMGVSAIGPMNFFKTGAVLTNHNQTSEERDASIHRYNPEKAERASLADFLKITSVNIRRNRNV